jgi:hypothetical protein
MRRLFVVMVVLALSLAFVPAVHAGQPEPGRERYETQGVNAFWYSTRRISSDVYLRITWYLGAYQSEEFWSDLYRSVERCERRPGRDRCRGKSNQTGVINDIGDGSFTVAADFSTAHLEATYRLRHYDDNGNPKGPAVSYTAVADFEGVGEIITSRNEYSVWVGDCLQERYRSKYESRDSFATGSINGRDVTTEDQDSGVGRGWELYVYNDCSGQG